MKLLMIIGREITKNKNKNKNKNKITQLKRLKRDKV